MTAPDQVLTDLLAATLIANSTLDVSNGERLWGAFPNRLTIGYLATYLALVVEQHTQAQTAELKARVAELEVLHQVDQDLFVQAITEVNRQKERAEKAEAIVTRVEELRVRMVARGSHEAGFVRAALEGEQQ